MASDSPVSIDLSNLRSGDSIKRTSAGTLEPYESTTKSPTTKLSTETFCSTPFLITEAELGFFIVL